MKIFVAVDNVVSAGAYYILPDTALNRVGQPFFLPDIDMAMTAFPTLAVRIGRLGKNIAEQFACRYIDSVAVAVLFRNESLLQQLRAEALPWSSALAYDGVLNVSEWHTVSADSPLASVDWSVRHNEISVPSFSVSALVQSPEQLVARLSRNHKLCVGDVVVVATSHPFACRYNDEISGFLQQAEAMRFRVK
ncbi:MAG: fumarylacetoacetate hydrolase family protein [Alloprevotella sp.]|nr:fumarylacetoacetate hydrolase family protein [Alloprevotella sp.]